MNKEEFMKYLPVDAYGIMSTVREDGMPEARCIEFQFEEDGKFYFATASNKEVYRQLVNHPQTAYTYMEPSGKFTVRITGVMKFVAAEDKEERRRIWDRLDEIVHKIHKTVDSPSLVLMYMDECTCKLAHGLGTPKSVEM